MVIVGARASLTERLDTFSRFGKGVGVQLRCESYVQIVDRQCRQFGSLGSILPYSCDFSQLYEAYKVFSEAFRLWKKAGLSCLSFEPIFFWLIKCKLLRTPTDAWRGMSEASIWVVANPTRQPLKPRRKGPKQETWSIFHATCLFPIGGV